MRLRPSIGRLLLCVKSAVFWLICMGCTGSKGPTVSIDFEGGSAADIRVDSDQTIHFTLESDPVGGERLWFYLQVTSPKAIRPSFVLERIAYTHQRSWEAERPVFSSDGQTWVRAEEVSYEVPRYASILGREPSLRFRSPLESKTLWVAYSHPYTTKKLQGFIDKIKQDARVRVSSFGRSESGAPIPRITIEAPGDPATTSRQVIWVLAREHPGETPASFVLEGFVDALLSSEAGEQLLRRYRFDIVPFVNLSGVVEGRYYRNPKGIDLAQDWKTFASQEMRSLHEAMRADLEAHRVALVFNLHSSHDPKKHFFLEIPGDWLPANLRELQRSLIQGSRGVHPQLKAEETETTWDYPTIASNYLNKEHQTLCLYLESSYGIGGDGTVVTPQTLRGLGTAMAGVFAKTLGEGH